jgi:hypothetical protein
MLSILMNPEEEKIFFQDYFEKFPMVLSRKCPEYFSQIFTLEDINNIFPSWDLEGFAIKVPGIENFDLFEGLPPGEKLRREKNTRRKVKELFKLYGKGYPILLNDMHKNWPPINEICYSIQNELNVESIGATACLFPYNSLEYQDIKEKNDIFLLQISGSSQLSLPKKKDSLNPGDLAYIPKGNSVNIKSKKNSSSIVLLIEFQYLTRQVFFLNLLWQLTNEIPNVEFRRSIPSALLKTDKMTKDIEKTSFAVLEKLHTLFQKAENLQKIRDQLIISRSTKLTYMFKGLIPSIHSLKHLSLDSEIRLRKRAHVSLVKEGQKLLWYSNDGVSPLPLYWEGGFEHILSGDKIRIKNIEGIQLLEEKMKLAELLIRNGVVEILSHVLS